ncbi:uncharacterized protein N7482_009511 [Penicillium canariense]|uniref:FR47-like domain-containing protein n=1 Tax=Penicillium canariense TaxID=189055 RepID=A0A9W9HMQ1_9EURO|nr:uncharacterized protein N7482_009511 [Penicillium canariense]KAJ5153033.1 hypothetical protein N7482_009511 [Penicillium canariense]
MAASTPPPAGAAPCFYEHTAHSITPHLTTQMPYSIALLRRIQHALAHPSNTAKILATFPPGATPDADTHTPWLAARVDLFRGRETQIILYSSLEAQCTLLPPIDPVPRSEDAASTAANANANANANYAVSTLSAAPAVLDLARAQFLAFLTHVKAHLLPEYLSSLAASDPESSATPESAARSPGASISASPLGPLSPSAPSNPTGVALIPAPDPRAFLFGTLHTGLFALLLRPGIFARVDGPADPLSGLRIHRFDNPPYYKYFFKRDSFSPGSGSGSEVAEENSLPPGYRYHDRRGREGVLAEHLDLVQSRTHIPRSRSQLQTLPGVAIYYDAPGTGTGADTPTDNSSGEDQAEMPIAWGFLGVDGAVTTLHVEPEHRKQGLAFSLSKEVMRRGMAAEEVFGAHRVGIVDGAGKGLVEGWAHADVAGYNNASRRVMEKIGGPVLTTVVWTVIELLD